MTQPLPPDIQAALAASLLPDEIVVRFAPAVGCTLVLTDRHLMLIREGATYRPRTGIQRWHLDRLLAVRLGEVRRGTSRLVIERKDRIASVFLTTPQDGEARTLLADVRRQIYAAG